MARREDRLSSAINYSLLVPKFGFISQKETSIEDEPVHLQYIPRNMHTVFALLWFVVVIHWLIFPYPSGLLHWHCGNLTIAPVPAKQPWGIWKNTSCESVINDCITTTTQSTTKPCAYFLGYTVPSVSPLQLGGCVFSDDLFTDTCICDSCTHTYIWVIRPAPTYTWQQTTWN